MYKLKISKIKDFDESNYLENAELTQEMCDIINPRLPRREILDGKALVSIFASNPTSLHSSKADIDKFRQVIKKGIVEQDLEFKEKTKDNELKIELIFFISKYYETSDLDNRIKTILDALQGYWFIRDSQIKKIIAEKYKVKEMKSGLKKEFYEQIYCCLSII